MFKRLILASCVVVAVGCAKDEAPAPSTAAPATASPSAAPPPGSSPDAHVHPDGTVHEGTHGQIATPEELAQKADIPVYPGAGFPEGVSNVRTSGAQTRYQLVMNTPDTTDKVRKFYGSKLKLDAKSGTTNELMGLTPKKHYVMIKLKPDGDHTEIDAVVIVQDELKS